MTVTKIGVAGAHSTGKTTFLRKLKDQLKKIGRDSVLVPDFGDLAVKQGIPNFTNHTFASTAWYIAKGIEFESRLSFESSIILVDRPIPDAVGYLTAALEFTNRHIDECKVQKLLDICRAWDKEYDLVFQTEIDVNVPLAEGRPDEPEFRALAERCIQKAFEAIPREPVPLRQNETQSAISLCLEYIQTRKTL